MFRLFLSPNVLQYLFIIIVCGLCSHTMGEYNGGTFLALAGENSILLAADSRFSSKLTGSSSLLSRFPRRLFRVGSRTLVGCYGIDSEIDILVRYLRNKVSGLTSAQAVPSVVTKLISDALYNSGLYCIPVIAGIEPAVGEAEQKDYPLGKPYLCSMDRLGAVTVSNNFVCVGTGAEALHAICEKMYYPNQPAETLIDVATKCMQLALQRDVLSGGQVRLLSMLGNGDIFEELIQTNDV